MMAEAAIDGVSRVLEEVKSFESELETVVFAREGGQKRGTARKRIAMHVPSWPKLAALQRFLACASLSEVIEGISARHFACFSSAELAGLVKCVYEDSSKRECSNSEYLLTCTLKLCMHCKLSIIYVIFIVSLKGSMLMLSNSWLQNLISIFGS